MVSVIKKSDWIVSLSNNLIRAFGKTSLEHFNFHSFYLLLKEMHGQKFQQTTFQNIFLLLYFILFFFFRIWFDIPVPKFNEIVFNTLYKNPENRG